MKIKTLILHQDVMLAGGLGTHKTINGNKIPGISLDHDMKAGVVLYKLKRGSTEIRGFLPITNVAHGEYEPEPDKV